MSDDVEWLDPRQIRAWLSLAGLVEALPPALSAQLKPEVGINNFGYMVMAAISESPNRTAPMSDLSAFAAGSVSRLSHCLTRMEKQGWVRRQPDIDNGRYTTVTLTDEGFAIVETAAAGHVRLIRRFIVDELGQDRFMELGRLVDQVLAVVNPDVHRVFTERYGPIEPA